MSCQVLKRVHAPDLYYDMWPGQEDAPIILFLSGYRGDRTGAKAMALAAHIHQKSSLGLVQFDYRGHGESGGLFAGCLLSDWYQDVRDILEVVVPKGRSVIAVGSSMGGWFALRALLDDPSTVQGVIGVAAAPDFTRGMVQNLTPGQRDQLAQTGRVTFPSNTPGYDPYDLTENFLADGDRLAILGTVHDTGQPITLIHGAKDQVVPVATTHHIRTAFPRANIETVVIPDGDHSLSRPQDLEMLYTQIDRMVALYFRV